MTELSDAAREYITERIRQNNVLDKIELEPESMVPGGDYHEITGIWEGALDEQFFVSGLYEVNVADWLAEFYNRLIDERGEGDYTIFVQRVVFMDDGEYEVDTDHTYRVEG